MTTKTSSSPKTTKSTTAQIPKKSGVGDADTPEVPPADPPGVATATAPVAQVVKDQAAREEGEAALAAEPAPANFDNRRRYPGRQRPPATTHFNLDLTIQSYHFTNASINSGSNNSATSIFRSKSIRPSSMTLPSRHKALQEMMRQHRRGGPSPAVNL